LVLWFVGKANTVQRGMMGDQWHESVQPFLHDYSRVRRFDTKLDKAAATLRMGRVGIEGPLGEIMRRDQQIHGYIVCCGLVQPLDDVLADALEIDCVRRR